MAHSDAGQVGSRQLRHSHLSAPDASWAKVAERQKEIDKLADKVFDLPIDEFRKIPYKPSPLPSNAPVLDRDIVITETEVTIRDGTAVSVRIYQPTSDSMPRMLFFNIHGGGWTVGNPQTEEANNRFISHQNSSVVISVNYRKAPEFPFPYALHDSLDVLEWAQRREVADQFGYSATNFIIGGGSAGANLAAAIAQIYKDEGKPGIMGQVLNIPVTCHPNCFPISKWEYTSYIQNSDAPIVSARRMHQFWNNYLPSGDSDVRASPLLASSLANLPPALVQIAGMDPLRDEGIAYAEAMKAEGVDVTLKIYPGLPHAFYSYHELDATARYYAAAVEWIQQIKSNNKIDVPELPKI